VTVLVTGAGGPAGVAVVRAVRALGRAVVAVDSDPMAVGARLADDGTVVPRYDDSSYVDCLIDYASRVGATVLAPTLAEELPVLARAHATLQRGGLRAWLPEPGAVCTCIDKWQFAQAMSAGGVPSPATALGTVGDVPGPWIVKPRFGRGSRDVYVVERRAELEWVLSRVTEPLVQQLLVGREFTVDTLTDREGTTLGAVSRWRLETRGGISTRGETFADDDVQHVVERALKTVGLVGPGNVQGFCTVGGDVALTEINPRFSGGLALSLAAGADLVGQYLRIVEHARPDPDRLSFRVGVRMMRYFEDVFER
jgi:carbamoyl-phosphate synthase large subunit